MQKLIPINNLLEAQKIFGVEDKNIKVLEGSLGIKIVAVRDGLLLKGGKNKIKQAEDVLRKMFSQKNNNKDNFSEQEIKDYIKGYPHRQECIQVLSARKKVIYPRSKAQTQYVKAIKKYDIVFAIGPAGTGKTYLAMAVAVNYLISKKVDRIILTRPAVEAGEKLGFLPGDMYEKLNPYLKPLYDALYDMLNVQAIENYLKNNIIDIVPLAYMRGRTLNNAFIILDEAQNCTSGNLKMFLTRLGFGSKAVITGDITQSDLPGGEPTGLSEAMNLLKPIKEICFIYLTKKDVVRHPLTQKIIQAYEKQSLSAYAKKTA